jgi:glycosyltransferase involved in cell wall biosynthesis
MFRGLIYRALYTPVAGALTIGERNRKHYLRHCIPKTRLRSAPYCVPSPAAQLTASEKQSMRDECRENLSIAPEQTVILFSGKLIPKKNPGLILDALEQLPPEERERFALIFVGSGQMEPELRERAKTSSFTVRLTGFVNQSKLPPFYFAADILVLPSRRMGETWGLVVNEALHAGCGVVMTDAVGCSAEFGSWERVRVIPEDNNVAECASAIRELAKSTRSFDWCSAAIDRYSVRAAAEGFLTLLAPPPQSRDDEQCCKQ